VIWSAKSGAPAKVNARLFIMLIAERGSEVELFEAASEISSRAVHVFEYLSGWTSVLATARMTFLSNWISRAWFGKATSRYANHFAAYESTQGNLHRNAHTVEARRFGERLKTRPTCSPPKLALDLLPVENPAAG